MRHGVVPAKIFIAKKTQNPGISYQSFMKCDVDATSSLSAPNGSTARQCCSSQASPAKTSFQRIIKWVVSQCLGEKSRRWKIIFNRFRVRGIFRRVVISSPVEAAGLALKCAIKQTSRSLPTSTPALCRTVGWSLK